MKVDPDSSPPERHSFQLEPKALFPALFSGERDPATRTHDPMPGEAVATLQGPDGHPCRPRETGPLCHLAIGRDLTAGYLRDDSAYAAEGRQGGRFPPSQTPHGHDGLTRRRCPGAPAMQSEESTCLKFRRGPRWTCLPWTYRPTPDEGHRAPDGISMNLRRAVVAKPRPSRWPRRARGISGRNEGLNGPVLTPVSPLR